MAEPPGGGGGTVKTPFGTISKKTAGIGAVIAGVLIVIVYERQKSASAATAASTAAAVPAAATAGSLIGSSSDPYPADGTVGNPADLYSTDPSTGETYGDEQSGAYGYGGTGSYGGGGGSYSTTGQYTSNSQWSQAAQADLVNANHTAETAAAALGVYITGAPATPAQQALIEQAIAFEGYPPVSGHTGMPPGINLAAAPPGGTATPGEVTVPKVTSLSGAQAVSRLRAAHLRGQLPAGRHGTYTVASQNPAAGSKVAQDTIIELGIHEPARKK